MALEVRSVSQPSPEGKLRSLLQSPRLLGHWQAEDLQTAPVPQAELHAPQCTALVRTSVSQPATPVQSFMYEREHWHAPEEQ